MAEITDLLEGFLNCHVCTETFRDPVSLTCNHSFCSSCLHTFWEQAKNKNCPICKRNSSREYPSVNLSLKDLADTFAKWKNEDSTEMKKNKDREEVVCDEHPEVPYWFCEDEQKAVCPVCKFLLHHGDKSVPLEQAVSDLKDQLKSDLSSLQGKRDGHEKVMEAYHEVIKHSKNLLLATEKQIRAEFDKIRQFLKEEEEARLAALREEEKEKGKKISGEMKMIQDQISSLSDSITAVEEDLRKPSVSFLRSYKPTQTRARARCSLADPQLVPGTLIDVAKHLGNLSFRVWEKMKEEVHFSPVILDPNTASPYLYLSDDLTSLRRGETKQQLPDNPERFTKYAEVLGSEGFTSGKHSWEVAVGDHPEWIVGLVKESVNKDEISASPECGIWCLLYHCDKYFNGAGETLPVKKSPQKIRVQLDYEAGMVSFYDPEDMTHICTHRDTFTEKMFPLFNLGAVNDAKTTDMTICQIKTSL